MTAPNLTSLTVRKNGAGFRMTVVRDDGRSFNHSDRSVYLCAANIACVAGDTFNYGSFFRDLLLAECARRGYSDN